MSYEWVSRKTVLNFKGLTETELAQIYDIILVFTKNHWEEGCKCTYWNNEGPLLKFLKERVEGKPLPPSSSGVYSLAIACEESDQFSIDFVYSNSTETGELERLIIEFDGILGDEDTELDQLLGWATCKPAWCEAEYEDSDSRYVHIEGVKNKHRPLTYVGLAMGQAEQAMERLGSAKNCLTAGLQCVDFSLSGDPEYDEMPDAQIEEVNCRTEELMSAINAFLKTQSS